MNVYVLHPDRSERLEPVTRKDQLAGVTGKFLYFSATDTLVIADSLDLFHRDIFLHLQSLFFRGLFPLPAKPDGYGRMASGGVASWESVFFGTTAPEIQPLVLRILALLA